MLFDKWIASTKEKPSKCSRCLYRLGVIQTLVSPCPQCGAFLERLTWPVFPYTSQKPKA